MKTFTTHNAAAIHSITIALILGLSGSASAVQASETDLFKAVENWQVNRLFEPTAEQRAYEKKGDIVIYDGLTDIMVEKAISQNFDRIQNMMFTRVVRTGKDGKPLLDGRGQVVTADDGC